MKYLLILSFSFFLLLNFAHAQQVPVSVQNQAMAELSKRGLDEEEVRQRLLEKGIDVDNVTMDQLPQLQSTIEQVIAELEAEKAQQTQQNESTPTSDPISDGVLEQMEAAKDVTESEAIKEEEIRETIPIEEIDKKVREVKIRGQELFQTNTFSVFNNAASSKAPGSYILSTGDELIISIFGTSQFDARFEVNEAGYVKPANMQKIFLRGLQLTQAKELLRSRFAQFYTFRKEQFAVSLASARLISVNIFGEVENNGTFSLPGINTAFNALVAAGGPTDIGSVRNIKIIRGEDTKTLDVYEFMTNPGIQSQYYLEDNDIIHVPIAEKVVAIQGAIKRPFLYELKAGENLNKLLEFAGGLKANAYKEVIQVTRYANNREILVDVPLEELLKSRRDFTLENGDKVAIKDIPSEAENFATIEGAVEFEGNYSLNNTPDVGSILSKGILLDEARQDVAFLIRKNTDGTNKLIQLDIQNILANPRGEANLKLKKEDRLIVYGQERFVDKKTIRVTGAVRDSIEYPFDPESSITIDRAILLAGGLKDNATDFGYIIRTNLKNPNEREYIKVDIKAALENPSSSANITLQPLDQLQVLNNASFSDEAMLRVTGAVRNPGKFKYDESLRLKDVITLSGGLSFGAALNRIDVFRLVIEGNESTRTIVTTLEVDSTLQNINGLNQNLQLKPYDEVVVRKIPEFEFQRYVTLEGEVKYPGRYALLDDNEPLSSIIERAGGLTEEAFAAGANLIREEKNRGLVVTNLDEALKNKNSKFNYILKAGDLLTVPKRDDLVSIKTPNTRALELYSGKFLAGNKVNVAYDPGKKANWYVKEYAVGFGDNANRKKVTVEYPNGELKRTKSFLFFKFYPEVEPGSVVSVGYKPPRVKEQRVKKERKPVDWEKVFASTFQAITVGVTTILLIQRL